MTASDDPRDSADTPLPWEYVLGFFTIPVLVASVLVGAYFLTSGGPFSCGFVTSRASWLCPWMQEFSGTVYWLVVLFFGGTVCLAMVVSYSLLFVRELLDRYAGQDELESSKTTPDENGQSVRDKS
ncbi:hypothetical protein [Haloarchaeobius sp. DT45]|uniref:hypothetical protein n=1 Tax=Haloarchaeobius sp. DT45 TaxID=3446116 RepID=UPI003F6C5B89